MKSLAFLGAFLMLFLSMNVQAQENRLNLGVGYMGAAIAHPGLSAELGYEVFLSERVSVPLKVQAGFFHQRRNLTATLLELSPSLRWYISNTFFVSARAGIGPMFSWHASDLGVFQVDESGEVTQTTSYAGTDIFTSLSPEIGIRTSPTNPNSSYIWIRAKSFWQFTVNEEAQHHAALEIGYTFFLK